MRQISHVRDYFLTSQMSKIGQNPYICGPRLRKGAEFWAPSGGAVLHLLDYEGDRPLRVHKCVKNMLKM